MITAPLGSTKPAAGVMATSPETTPDSMPISETFFFSMTSTSFQVRAPAAAASTVFSSATPISSLAAPAEPALKPIQPTRSRDAPIIVRTGLCGLMGSTP